jgi:hypothetical protein
MAKTKISEFDTDPSLNTDIDSINIAEGCAPSGINNAIRELMSQLKNQQDGSSLDTFTVGNTLTVNGANSLRLADTDSSNYVGLKAPGTVSTNYTLTLPTADGTSGQAIKTDGAGALSFGTLGVSAGGTGVTTSTGTGNVVLSTSPTLVTPVLGTPTSGALTNCTADGTNAVGYRNIPQSGAAKTSSYALATTDVGEVINVGTGGSITVPDATFAAGDAVIIFNNTASSITMTMTITNAYIAGTDADKATISVATRGVANILFVTGTTCVVTGNVS